MKTVIISILLLYLTPFSALASDCKPVVIEGQQLIGNSSTDNSYRIEIKFFLNSCDFYQAYAEDSAQGATTEPGSTTAHGGSWIVIFKGDGSTTNTTTSITSSSQYISAETSRYYLTRDQFLKFIEQF